MEYKFQTGDIISAEVDELPLILHRGIVLVENGIVNVVHITPDKHNEQGGNIITEPLESFIAGGRTILPKETIRTGTTAHQIKHSTAPIIRRTFDTIRFNCEHFVNFVSGGKITSPQVAGWTIVTVLAITLVVLAIKHSKQK